MTSYTKPGFYVAICNRPDFDGHYVKVFEKPDDPHLEDVSAMWYFLNMVDPIACLEAVYPIEILTDNAFVYRNQLEQADIIA